MENVATEEFSNYNRTEHSTPLYTTPDTAEHLRKESNNEYPVDCLLGKWRGLYFVKWVEDGCYSWEPRENILDDELVENFEEKYEGFCSGVEVLRTRTRNGKTEYRLRCMGRPQEENWWVPEKYMSPEMVKKYKPVKRKGKRGGRKE